MLIHKGELEAMNKLRNHLQNINSLLVILTYHKVKEKFPELNNKYIFFIIVYQRNSLIYYVTIATDDNRAKEDNNC